MEPSTLAKVTDFEGHRVTTVIFEGRPAWIAAQVGEALGYAEGRHLVDKIAASWRDDFIDGTDFEILSNGRLAKFRADSGESQESPPREGGARSLTILYESGLHLALLRTRKPAGRRLRRLLATEVLPQLTRTTLGPPWSCRP
jgi:prophage antirepressor-like protein